MEKKYWQNFEELNQSEAEQKALKNEFKEELPFEDLADESIFNAKTPRRDFLRYMGFSTAAAAIAASCEMPVRKSIPFCIGRMISFREFQITTQPLMLMTEMLYRL